LPLSTAFSLLLLAFSASQKVKVASGISKREGDTVLGLGDAIRSDRLTYPQVPAYPRGDLVREQPTAYLEGRAVVSGRLLELEAGS
jgi:hypothetical protein